MSLKSNLPAHLLILGVVSLAFFAASSFGLTMCDDYLYVMRPDIVGGLNGRGLLFAVKDYAEAIWMPLTDVTYMLDWSLGWGTGGMHVQNILWLMGDASLLYVLLCGLFRNRTAAFMAALVWAVHPLRVESVVWIASRKDVVSVFFLLAALLAWLKSGEGNIRWLVVSFALVLVSAMAKPSAMVFPVLAFSMDFLLTGRRKRIGVYGAFVALSVLIAVESAWAQQAGGAMGYAGLIPLWYRLVNAAAALTVYVGNVLYPADLAMQCMIRYPEGPRLSLLGMVGLSVIGGWGLWIVGRRYFRYRATGNYEEFVRGGRVENALLCGLVVFFGCLVPFLGVAGFGVHAFADRFTLLPALGLSWALCAVLDRGRGRRLLQVVVAAVIVLLIVQTRRQVEYWRSDETLMLHTLSVDTETNIDVQRALGMYYWEERQDLEKVCEHLGKALECAWCEDVRDSLSVSAHLLIDALYATGRIERGNDLYFWFRKVDYRHFGERSSPEFLMAEALYTLHSKEPDRLEKVDRLLETLKEALQCQYLHDTVAYRRAEMTGDWKKFKEQKSKTPSHNAVDYIQGRWMVGLLPK